jgi:hypothetical protein
MMARFCRYLEKVFDWGAQMAELRDSRRQPQIPTSAIFLSILMMFATRLRSLNAMEGELRMPGRWEKIVGRRKPSADRLGQVGALLDTEQLRDLFSGINHKLRRNKALEDNPWALRFVAMDGHEFFSQ